MRAFYSRRLLGIALGAGLVFLAGLWRTRRSTRAHPRPTIAAGSLEDALARGPAPTVLDVRSAWEYRRGHIPGARHAPFWTILGGARPDVSSSVPVVVYCGHGPRAWMAAAALRRRGFADVRRLEGDLAGWRRTGRAIAVDAGRGSA